MIWLLLSILSSTAIMLIFKSFKRFQISTFHAIVVNYFTAMLVGFPFVSDWDVVASSYTSWYYYALILGSLFIALFFLIGRTTQELGISVATVSMKLGYVLPIVLAFTWYQESLSTIKIIAILLTFVAVVLSSMKDHEEHHDLSKRKWLFLLPLIIFIGSGICDAIVQFTEKKFFQESGFEAFLIILFLTAATLGLIAAIVHDVRKGENNFTRKNIIAGIFLGIPNYFSIYFLFKALNFYLNNSAAVFPINNVGIVVASTLFAVLIFSEKLNRKNVIGFVLAIISIILMSLEHLF
ncbi:MAG: drug/metabolite transporter (DMT)-like permease [Chitinophagales bacterium]|jgi:drug/metabolite transporter (DMT)-like permease